MELHQLRYFVAVADLKSFTRAAERCYVAQPSLSQQIIKLEAELGKPLFERLGRTVRLTDAGRALYHQALSILASVDAAKLRVQDATDELCGTVTVGAIPTVAPFLLPAVLQAFRKQFPKANIVLHEDYTDGTVAGCLSGDLDLGVLALPILDSQLQVEPLFEEELLLVTSKRHRLAKAKRVTFEDLNGEPFILLNDMHCLGRQIVSFCSDESCSPAIACRSAELLTVQQLVATGFGITLLPEMAAKLDRDHRRVYRRFSGTAPTRTIGLVWHKHRYQRPLVRELMALLKPGS